MPLLLVIVIALGGYAVVRIRGTYRQIYCEQTGRVGGAIDSPDAICGILLVTLRIRFRRIPSQ
jgi:hypothetical protein